MAKRKTPPAATSGKSRTVRGGTLATPAGYGALLEDLTARIRTTQVKAALSVNRGRIVLYWHIGGSIVARQRTEGWGKAVVDRLANDLQREFPGMAGFSPRNIWRMRAFYLAWTDEILAQPVRELGQAKLAQPARESGRKVLPQLVAELDGRSLPRPVAEIPWGHNVWLMERLKDPAIRLWYARQTVSNGWSRAMLTHWIESDLHARQGRAITNFKAALPAPQSDLAAEVVRDPFPSAPTAPRQPPARQPHANQTPLLRRSLPSPLGSMAGYLTLL